MGYCDYLLGDHSVRASGAEAGEVMSDHYLLDGYRKALESWQAKMYETPLSSAMYCYAFAIGWEHEVRESRDWDEVPSDMIPGYMAIICVQNGVDTHQRAQQDAYRDGRAAGATQKREQSLRNYATTVCDIWNANRNI